MNIANRPFGLTLVLCCALAATVLGQTPPPAEDNLKFEVASIKKSQSLAELGSIGPRPGGRVMGIHVPPRALIFWAYTLRPYQIIGPDWIVTDRFDVEAKAEGDSPFVQLQGMMRTLLADRFRLVFHRETRDVDGFMLARVRPDRLGPNLVPSVADCMTIAGSPPQCRENRYMQGNLKSVGMPSSMLTLLLGQALSAPVVDQTQLAGTFDVELQWSPEMAPLPDLPSIFTAVQEQLGLKLEGTRVPIEVLVIDQIERPTPD